MARIKSSEAALRPPISLTEKKFASLKAKIGRELAPEVREQIEEACNSYLDHRELQKAAPAPHEVVDKLDRLSKQLRAALKEVSALLSSDDPGARESVNLLEAEICLRQGRDPEVVPFSDFSRRLRATVVVVSEVSSRCTKGVKRGPNADLALDHLIERLAAIAEAAHIPVKAHFSQAAGGRTAPFVDLVRGVYRLCHGGRVPAGSGLEERIARVIARLKVKIAAKRS